MKTSQGTEVLKFTRW